ncbi:MAG: DUF4422 domain-containing protein [Selenomonadaceae bacterium]|nr:DUF4422 domain-containing protein [Selenomonadaceae bacterium]
MTANAPINLFDGNKNVPFVPLAEVSSVEYDFVLVIGAQTVGMTAINNIANQLKFPTEKILPDFIVCISNFTIERYLNNLLSIETLFSSYADNKLLAVLQNLQIKTLLDIDSHFAKSQWFNKMGNDLTQIDCIAEQPIYPLKENFYRRVYRSLSEVGYRHYAAAIIDAKTETDFIAKFNLLENISDTIIVYVSASSELQKFIPVNGNHFSEVKNLPTELGNWFIITRKKKPEDFCIYVVTHKPTPHDGKLPKGYKIIHAGRAQGKDLGYLGDNTGDNISQLNPYINEITALYWMWKNTSHSIIGLSHYRRFFTESNNLNFSYDKILTKEVAAKILQDYDIIVVIREIQATRNESITRICGKEFLEIGKSITKKYLLKYQPDYLDAFDFCFESYSYYKCQVFVTRGEIFDAYCKWLFSFLIDATNEMIEVANLKNISGNPKRVIGYFCERMLSTWLTRNHLRIKEMNIMVVNGI